MIGSMVGTIANIVLDPLFISGLHMGAAGAAIATTIGNILASLYFVWYFLKRSGQLSILPKDFTLGENIPQRVCTTGFPTAIFSVLMSVSTIVVNQILVKYGNAPVAAIGIVFKANMFITFLQMGLANGVQPLLGYSYGAGISALPGSRTLYEDLLPDSRRLRPHCVFVGKELLSACSSVMMRWFIMG